MRQSNSYIVIYAAVLTIVCGGLLAMAAEGLKEKQQFNVALEQKKNILSTVINIEEGQDVNRLYEQRVKQFVVDFNGDVRSDVKPQDVNLSVEYKKPAKDRLLPVYEFVNESDSSKVDNVVLPVYGYGLWNDIWGFVALESDMNTIKGVKFDHKGETPGLGARIESDPELQARYQGKSIYEGDKLVSVTMMKGEGNDYSDDKHKVDGMSGATLTAKGVNNMLSDYLQSYERYLKKKKTNS
ncbi:NADH:ubiquinone reductase (Na(+)-transporting) subunit C [Chryseolinea sp. H1M3-3]|uniref:NADH:ubiquinone reductase (Na(+)-transporting) subunit C n=1 Tax=Chryseolinea sp. H1M3-3 TaxID=3034144 RepID=UPI0023EB9C9E|nr:NADH:ubiquinone reductase (Na(+)-transporting) subunit C [Chryseolinea sp. H1M3-3]